MNDGRPSAPAPRGFDFGENWLAFSASIDAEQLTAVVEWLLRNVPREAWRGRRAVDVGCGSGLFAVTRRNPFRMQRGMRFWRDVVDWIGGWPYEYASPAEVAARLGAAEFECRLALPADTPIGCNEFVLRRARQPRQAEVAASTHSR